MRCRLCLGPEPQEKEIDPAQYREPVDVLSQSTNQVVCFGLHRGETLDLGEEFITKQTFEISDKTQSVVEAHRRERVLGEHMQPFEKLVDLACFGQAIDQAMYRLINRLTETGEIDLLLERLHVFTLDALAPMRLDNGLSFVRDFERLLGDKFFAKVKSFTPMQTETDDLVGGLRKYVDRLAVLGGIDLFFLGLGARGGAASHLCYIKPGSGAKLSDYAGVIPISSSILEHHIAKFKVGGSIISAEDESECRNATHILTLGPAAILSARRIVQSIVDASTAPGKRQSFRRLIETRLSADPAGLARQVDENPGLLIRLHGAVRSFILPDLLA